MEYIQSVPGVLYGAGNALSNYVYAFRNEPIRSERRYLRSIDRSKKKLEKTVFLNYNV